MDDFLALVVIIFVVVSLYWQYHAYTNSNSLLRRIKWLEEKLTEQQEKLFKLLNKDSTVDIRTELDAQKGEVKDVSRDIKKDPQPTGSPASTYQSKTVEPINTIEHVQNKVENKNVPVYQRAQVSQETAVNKDSPKKENAVVQSPMVNDINLENKQSNKPEISTAPTPKEVEPYRPKVATSRFAHHYQKEAKQTYVKSTSDQLVENRANGASANLVGSETDYLGDATPQANRPASQYRPNLNSRPKRQQKSILGLIWNWVVTGNPLAKIGMLLLFFGLSYLLKYSIENELISASTRLMMAGTGCLALLGIGWWLRKKNLIYALILQGGGIGGFYITIFAATKIYDFIPIGIALAIMVFVCIVSVILAVLHRAISLAVLASLGGYLAPVLLSTGSGNYIALFSYYLILSIGILIISHWQVWRLLNLIGFAFTFGIGFIWAIPNYTHADYLPCQLFLIANWLIFGVATELSTLKNKLKLNIPFDATLLFGTPLIGFIFQHRLASEWQYGVAIASSLYGLAYFALSWFALKRYREEGKLLAIAFFMLSVTFATLAVPFAFSAEWTSIVWAIEGVMILAFSVLQQQKKPAIAGTILVAVSFVLLVNMPIISLGDWLMLVTQVIVVFAVGVLWYQARFTHLDNRAIGYVTLFIAAVSWGYSVLLLQEYGENWLSPEVKSITFAYILMSCWGMFFAGKKTQFSELASCSILLWPISALIMLVYIYIADSLINNWFSAIIWITIFVSGFYLLKVNTLLSKQRINKALIHCMHLIFIGLFLFTEIIWLMDATYLYVSLHFASVIFAISLFIAISYLLAMKINWIKEYQNAYWIVTLPILGLLALSLIFANFNAGTESGVKFIPLFNLMDLMGIVGIWVGYKFISLIKQSPKYQALLKNNVAIFNYIIPAAIFWWANGILLRGLVFATDIDWSSYAIINSKVIQTVLAIVWAITALVTMVMATRKKSRSQWFIGGGLLAVVIAKLFLIDTSLSSGLLRALAFIGVAILILLIGYFSPLPPKKQSHNTGV
ncbi:MULTISPECIES: DUF2339 domain-containing protein [Enterobacterales]|uniref:DUF2339 domain-containing protein n=1 Tax=Enterobacterales TaxID=91347 RepID=UPI00084821BA|nr:MULTISPECIES: DUF2339 domain-containing protein [Enterobacterales]ODQ05272.1 hypothetical protein BGK50_04620 [Shigella sp. FC130]OEI92724.1 hypothetical protein BHE86_06110 [Shigella sp. FC1655]WOO48264.1 DUF2339 domain-containing protein [Hafnia alvei]WPF02728.1 DUF2339 domain-containing protein [Proteus vulgaris]